ncbi:MAG: RDD family protein [bacterium]
MEAIKEMKNAPFWKRLAGLLIDTSLIFIIVLTISGEFDSEAIGYTIGLFLGSLAMGPILKFVSLLYGNSSIDITVFIMLLIYYCYCLLTELAFKNTIGKLMVGLRIISIKTGDHASNLQIIGRTLSRMIPFDVFSFFAKNPRGWHDSIPKTRVVNK